MVLGKLENSKKYNQNTMPHIILEHSDNVQDEIDYKEFFKKIHQVFLENGYADINAFKSRYIIHDKYYLGNGDIDNIFIHLSLSVLAGKSTGQLQNIAKQSKRLLHDTYKVSNDYNPRAFSAEIREMNKEIYLK